MKSSIFPHRNTWRASTMAKMICKGVFALSVALLWAPAAEAQVNVLTFHNDNLRTGQNQQETILTPANVTDQFGKLFSSPVDGQIYAQPLYVSNLNISGGTHNVVFAATEGDSVYAFDADDGSQLWQASMIDPAHGAAPGATTVSTDDVNCTNISPQYGITGTPVIDLATSTIYVEAKSKENGTFVQRLHALDIATGDEKFPGPAVIDGSSSGVTFDALRHQNRPGLLLANGTIYIGFGSHCDQESFYGWVLAYDAATFAQQGVFVTTPNDDVTHFGLPNAGGIWMSGAGLASDGSGIFAATGNGDFDTVSVPATDVGDSIIKLALNGGTLALADYFTPYNQAGLDQRDDDLGSGGVLLLPDQSGSHPHELVQVGKEGTIYVIDRDQMTVDNQHYCANCTSDPQIVQEVLSQVNGLFSMPAYWNNIVYFWGWRDSLKAFSVTDGLLSFLGASADTYGFPGAVPTVSANGSSNGIVWSLKTDAFASGGPAVLRAHDALSLSLLYSSDRSSLDNPGIAIKFTTPTVANGKVYVGTAAALSGFGLLPAAPGPVK